MLSASATASAITALKPRSQISCIVCQTMPCSRIHANVSAGASSRAAPPGRTVAGHRAGLDEPAHRGAVAGQVAVDEVGGVGMGVEVHDPDVAVAVHVGDRGGGRPGDRVVAAEDDRHDAAGGDLVHPLADVGVAGLGLAVRAERVAVVDDLEVVEDLDAQVEVVGAGLVGQRADRPRPEAGARAGWWSRCRTAPRRSRRRAARRRAAPASVTSGRWPNVLSPPKT